MSKERLSKLQKGIIMGLYSNDHWADLRTVKKVCLKIEATSCTGNALHVTVARSIWNLKKKGFVKVFAEVRRPVLEEAIPYLNSESRKTFKELLVKFPSRKILIIPIDSNSIFNIDIVALLPKGKIKARELVIVNSRVNNKKREVRKND